MSEGKAFYSLDKINELTLKPGDKVLLERGSVFQNGFLHLKGDGSEEAPIVVDSYGKGNLPIIETNGQGIWYQNYRAPLGNAKHKYQGYVSSSVLLYDVEYVEIKNLEITNKAPKIETAYNAEDVMNRTGVAAVAQNEGTLNHIYLDNLYVHDVIGNVYDKHMNNGGIYFTAFQPMDASTGIAKYDDVKIGNISNYKIESGKYSIDFDEGEDAPESWTFSGSINSNFNKQLKKVMQYLSLNKPNSDIVAIKFNMNTPISIQPVTAMRLYIQPSPLKKSDYAIIGVCEPETDNCWKMKIYKENPQYNQVIESFIASEVSIFFTGENEILACYE